MHIHATFMVRRPFRRAAFRARVKKELNCYRLSGTCCSGRGRARSKHDENSARSHTSLFRNPFPALFTRTRDRSRAIKQQDLLGRHQTPALPRALLVLSSFLGRKHPGEKLFTGNSTGTNLHKYLKDEKERK